MKQEKRGRLPFSPTAEQRKEVRLFKFDGWSNDRISRILGISTITLVKYFVDEIEHGADDERREILQLLKKAAEEKLSISAIKTLARIGGIGSADDEMLASAAKPKAAAATPKPLGKKEQAALEAQIPDTSTEIGQLMARQQAGLAVH